MNQYNVYYFESAEGRFVSSDIGEGQINLNSQLVDKGYGLLSKDLTEKNNDELNTLFINARISKFRREAPDFWHIQDTLTFMNNVEFNAGTDERAKIHIHTLSVWRILNGDGVSMMLIPGLIRLIVVCRRNRIVWKRMM